MLLLELEVEQSVIKSGKNLTDGPCFRWFWTFLGTVSHFFGLFCDWRSRIQLSWIDILGIRDFELTLSEFIPLNKHSQIQLSRIGALGIRIRIPEQTFLKLIISLIGEETRSSQQWVWLKSISQALFLVYRWGLPRPCFQMSNLRGLFWLVGPISLASLQCFL